MFCLDIWKQFLTAGFAHALNLVLAVYIKELTHAGSGCSWYLVTMLLDATVGIMFSYGLFRIIDELARKFGIEVLK